MRTIAIVIALGATSVPVVAEDFSDEGTDAVFLDDAAIVPDIELAQQRGGFVIDGVDVKLGAEIRTYLGGELALLTTVTWDDNGVTRTQTPSAALTQAGAEIQDGVLTSGGISMRVGNSTVFLANGGQTALIHETDAGLQNILVNTASNVSVLSEVNAQLDLGGYEGLRDTIQAARLGDSINAAMAGAGVDAIQ